MSTILETPLEIPEMIFSSNKKEKSKSSDGQKIHSGTGNVESPLEIPTYNFSTSVAES